MSDSVLSNATSTVTVGKVRDAHGLKGELFIVLFAKKADWSEGLKQLTLLQKQKVIQNSDKPEAWEEFRRIFTVKRIKPHKLGLIVKVDEINDRTEAEKFRGAVLEIPAELLISNEGETIFLKEIEGFVVFDGEVEVGPIVGFTSNGPQDILEVKTSQGDALVPFVPQFLNKLDFKNRKLWMTLPEGLLPTPE